MFMALKVIERVHPDHLMNVEQRQAVDDPQTKSTDFDRMAAIVHIHHRHSINTQPES